MKEYPRIHDLCTVGLIHHQDCEYRIHPFRTDFVGDSGCGKSMIADFMQLIFVGAGTFSSATAGTGPREANTMVLESPGKGTDFGYVYLNVEVDRGKYLTVGTYIERNGSGSRSFLVQAGYDWSEEERLKPFEEPLSKSEIMDGDDMLPLEDFQARLEQNGLFLKDWQRLKTFHHLLAINKILPLDLSVSVDILKDYKKIIQSFSRRTLDTSKSDSLKNFLFGKEEHTRIESDYKKAIQELEQDVQTYGNNLTEIDTVTKKSQELGYVKTARFAMVERNQSWVLARVSFWSNQVKAEVSTIRNQAVPHEVNRLVLIDLREKAEHDMGLAESNQKPLLDAEEKALGTFTKANGENQKLKNAQGILNVLDSEDGLLERFTSYTNQLRQHSLLQSMTQEIGSNWAFFEKVDWEGGYSEGLLNIQNKIKTLTETLANLDALRAYNDLNNENSLARWAVDQKRAFTNEEESVLVHFATQGITRTKPEIPNGLRFLPEPKELFEKPVNPLQMDKAGFWLSLDGVHEYVKYVPRQILDRSDPQLIKEHFEKQSKGIDDKIRELKVEQNHWQKLLDLIKQVNDIEAKIEAYGQREELKNFIEHPELKLTKEQFDETIQTLEREQEIVSAFESATKDYNAAKDNAAENKEALKDYKEALDELGGLDLSTHLKDELKALISDSEIQAGVQAIKEPNSPRELRQEVQQRKSRLLNYTQQQSLMDKLSNAKTEASNARLDAELLEIPFPESFEESLTNEEVGRLGKEHDKAVLKYQNSFDSVVRDFVPENDQDKFKDNYDFLGLCLAILPKSFASLEFTEETVIQEVENHLKQIARKNQDLNERKFQRIRDLVEDVSTEISSRLDKIRRMKRIFNDDNSEITGGHFVKLEESFNADYPRAWLTRFAEEFNSQSGLFAAEGGLYDRVSKLIGIEEKLVEAFHTCGGPSNIHPTASQLLDPNSYFELSFSMETKNGKKNDGSTGQTYAATALLCIARLSLLNPDESTRTTGLRFMPVDEAEGIGTNYNMLMRIAEQNDYQIISFSQRPLPSLQEGGQNVYFLQKNMDTDEKVNHVPTAILGIA